MAANGGNMFRLWFMGQDGSPRVFWGHLTQGEFPAYRQVIPDPMRTAPIHIHATHADLVQAMQLVWPFVAGVGAGWGLRIVVHGQFLEFSLYSADHTRDATAHLRLTIPATCHAQGFTERGSEATLPFVIGVDPRYIRDAVTATCRGAEHVDIHMNGKLAPIQILDPMNEHAVSIVMPMRID